MTEIRFSSFPRTMPPPDFAVELVDAFIDVEDSIGTMRLEKGLTSDGVLAELRPKLLDLGFEVEQSKLADGKVRRPVFFGENGAPDLQYEVDAFHPGWRCGLEVEAGRAWMGNAIYRDLIQALVMVQVDVLALAVPLGYRYKSRGRTVVSKDYANACAVANALYGHSRMTMPYGLLLIGY
jgi:hypothetical protein